MSNPSGGYVTRYSGGYSTPLSKNGFACISLAEFLSKEFGPGHSYYYHNNLYSTTSVKESEEVFNYFFTDTKIIERKNRLDYYRQEAINVVRDGWAIPSQYTSCYHDPNAGLPKEELVKLAEDKPEIPIKLKKATSSSISLDELLRGPIEFHITPEESQIPIVGATGLATPLMCNVSDDTYLNVSLVIREWSERQRSAHEMYLHYLRGTCPPYYIHLDFGNEFRIDILEYMKSGLPPQPLIDAVTECLLDRKKEINSCDLRFVNSRIEKFPEEEFKSSLILSVKDADKQTRDKIIKGICPFARHEHVVSASDVARQMAACDMPFNAIIDVCKAICAANVKYDHVHSPNQGSPEFENLEAISMRIMSHDFSSNKITLEQMISSFSIKASVHVEKIDSALEFCIIGKVYKSKDRRYWWYDVARILGKEIICSRIKNAIKSIKDADWNK